MEVKSRYVSLVQAIEGVPSESDFELRDTLVSLGKVNPGEIIVKNLYLSVDPYQLNRMKSYSPSQATMKEASRILPGQVINTSGVGRVVASANAEFGEGDMVVGLLGWEEYSVIQPVGRIMKLENPEFPLSYYVNVLGTSGHTANSGFFKICKPQKGERIFISAASGSVGSIVGQLAKLFGCYVVGCARSKKKVDILKEKLGFDDAFNYREEADLKATIKRYFPDGTDIYFDNVGGEMLNAAVANVNCFGRIAVCGVISEYTNSGMQARPSTIEVIYKRLTIQGFLLVDHLQDHPDFISKLSDYLRRGQIHVLQDFSNGVESMNLATTKVIGQF